MSFQCKTHSCFHQVSCFNSFDTLCHTSVCSPLLPGTQEILFPVNSQQKMDLTTNYLLLSGDIKTCFCTGSLPPARVLEMEATSVQPVSLGTLASTVNGKLTWHAVSVCMETATEVASSTLFWLPLHSFTTLQLLFVLHQLRSGIRWQPTGETEVSSVWR